jgi:hypothetical protein
MVGTLRTTTSSSVEAVTVLPASTTGTEEVTCTSVATAAGESWNGTVSTCPAPISTSGRTTVSNPLKAAETEYFPGGSN